MVPTLAFVGIGLMLAGLLTVAVESRSGAGSALLPFETDGVETEIDEPYGADD